MTKSLLSLLALDRPRYQTEIETQMIKLLYGNLYRSLFAIVFIATFLLSVLWPVIHHMQLILWYTLIFIVVLARLADTIVYHRNPNRYHSERWYQHLCLGVASTALLWGFTPLLFFLEDQLVYNMFISIVIVGLSAGAVTSLAADRRLSHIYLYVLLIPMAVELIQQEGFIYTALFSFTLLFMVFVSTTLRQTHETLLNVFETQKLYHDTQKKLTESEKRHRMMFEQAPTGTFYYDNDLTILDCNTALTKIMLASKEQLIGLNLNQIPDQRPFDTLKHTLKTTEPAIYEGPYHSKFAGLNLWIKLQLIPLIDINGNNVGGLAVMEDKTKEHEAREKVEFLSLHDPLTALPNRQLLKERLQQLIREDKREKSYSAVLFLDLDRFKNINDAYGHNIGDKLLIAVAKRFKVLLRTSDTLSRLGGDEFVMLLPHLSHDQETALYHAYEISKRIHSFFEEPFQLDDYRLHLSCSIGIVVMNGGKLESDEILRRADIAMYQAKDEGRSRSHFYDAMLDERTKTNIYLLENLRYAITRQELSLHYQPILQVESGVFCGAEALLRWKHGDQGYISLERFIPIAEESGLMNEIGRWVITQACQQMYQWQKNGHTTLKYLTVNVSPKQLIDPQFSSFLLQTIEQNSLNPALIKLEITEHALIDNFEDTRVLIENLKKEGVEFIIDDFGTGYSSLSYIKNLPFSALKIDQTFIRDMLTDSNDAALIEAIITLAHKFNYHIVAEGVEDQAQLDKLMTFDKKMCYQGFLTCKPCSSVDFETFLTSYVSKESIL